MRNAIPSHNFRSKALRPKGRSLPVRKISFSIAPLDPALKGGAYEALAGYFSQTLITKHTYIPPFDTSVGDITVFTSLPTLMPLPMAVEIKSVGCVISKFPLASLNPAMSWSRLNFRAN